MSAQSFESCDQGRARCGRPGAAVPSRVLAVAFVVAAVASGCGSDLPPAAPAAPTPAKLVAKGKLQATVDGTAVTLDYDGIAAQVAATHRLTTDPKAYTCVAHLSLALERPDGTCRIELVFRPTPTGLKVNSGKFFAAAAVTGGGATLALKPCAGWPGADKATKEQVYEIGESDAVISLDPLGPGKANQAKARLDGLKLGFTGAVTLKKLATKVALDLAPLSLAGSLESTGDPAASCGGATGKTGPSECSKQGKPGDKVDDVFRRDSKLFTCDGEVEYDLGELCGSDAIWIIDWRDWTYANAKLLTQVGQVRDAFKGKNLGIAVVVVEGKDKVVVVDPASGKGAATGPSPTAAECVAIGQRDGLPKDIPLLVDKDKQLVIDGKNLTSTGLVPSMLFAKPDGTIVKQLPGPDKKAPTTTELQAAIQETLDAP